MELSELHRVGLEPSLGQRVPGTLLAPETYKNSMLEICERGRWSHLKPYFFIEREIFFYIFYQQISIYVLFRTISLKRIFTKRRFIRKKNFEVSSSGICLIEGSILNRTFFRNYIRNTRF